jgi:hypothetical protein
MKLLSDFRRAHGAGAQGRMQIQSAKIDPIERAVCGAASLYLVQE